MAGLLDYIEAPIHAIGGLFGGGNSAPAPAPPPTALLPYDPTEGAVPGAPPAAQIAGPQGAPAAWTPMPQPVVHGALTNFFDRNLLGGTIAQTDAQQRRADLAAWQNQNLLAEAPNLPPAALQALKVGGPGALAEWAKNRVANQVFKPNETGIIAGDTGHPFYAPGFDPVSGKAIQLGPNASLAASANSAGGDFAEGANAIYSKRNGAVAGTVSQPQIVPAGSSPGAFTPNVAPGPAAPQLDTGGPQPVPGGPPVNLAASAPQLGQAPPMATPGAQSGVPRGIRNNNPGNVKALPGGQLWQGQTGVDEMGHAVFANPTDGVHATLTNLQAYATKHGINTVAGIAQRWKGEGDASGYTQYLAKQVGVKPGDKIDLNDPAVLGKVAQGIFQFENGPKAMATRFPGVAAQPPQVGQGPAPQATAAAPTPAAGAPPGWQVGAAKPLYSPQVWNADKGRFEQTNLATGEVTDAGKGAFNPQEAKKTLLDSEQVKNYSEANSAFKSMLAAAALPNGGMRAYAMRDLFARVVNPKGAVRLSTIDAIRESQGVPDKVKAYFMNLKGDGNVPESVAQEIVNVSRGFLAGHHSTAKQIIDSYAQQATRAKVDPRDATVPMDAMPPNVHILPPAGPHDLVLGDIYKTRKGLGVWTQKGFVPYGR